MAPVTLADQGGRSSAGSPRTGARRLELIVDEADDGRPGSADPRTRYPAERRLASRSRSRVQRGQGPPRTRALARLDEAGIRGRLRLVGGGAAARAAAAAAAACAVAEQATQRLGRALRRLLPTGATSTREIELDSSDFLDRGALLSRRSTRPIPAAPPASVSARRGEGLRRRARDGAARVRTPRRRAADRSPSHPARPLRHERSRRSQGPVWREDGRAV